MEAGVNGELASAEAVAALINECLHRHCKVWQSLDNNLQSRYITHSGAQEIRKSMVFHEERIMATCEVARRLNINLTEGQRDMLPAKVVAEMIDRTLRALVSAS